MTRSIVVRWDLADLAAVGDLATEYGVRNSTIVNWINRYDGFPAPLIRLSTGAVYSRAQVREWHDGQIWLSGGRNNHRPPRA